MTEAVLFYLFSLVAIVAGLGVVLARNPITSALSLVVCFFFLAADYVTLDAHFVAVIQILVYAGAIMVLFIFVIMLLNLRESGPAPLGELSRRALVGVAFAGLLAVGLITAIGAISAGASPAVGADYGTIAQVGKALFGGRYLLPFESVSVLLTVGVVGAVVLAKKEI
jgi:NADH-quinone oxidoreductase subunit J